MTNRKSFGLVFRCAGAVLFCLLVLVGCAQPAPSGEEEAEGEAREWDLVSHHPTTLPMIGEGMMEFADRVNARSEELTINTFPAGQLYQARMVYDAVGDGLAEAGTHALAYGDEAIPVLGMFHVPFLYTDMEKLHKAFHGDFGERLAELARSDANVVPLYYDWVGVTKICNDVRPVKVPADLEGLKIRTTGGAEADVLEELGASPVTMTSSELYAAMQRGVVDGAITSLVKPYGFEEVQDYMSWLPMACVPGWTFVNADTWDALPEDLKGVLESVGSEVEEERFAKARAAQEEELEYLKQHMEVWVAEDEDIALWVEAIKPAHEDYFAEQPTVEELWNMYRSEDC